VPARSAVVSFVRYERAPKSTPAYMAFVLRAGEAGPTPVLLGSAAAIEQAVARWRKDVPSGLRDDGTMIATAEASLRVLGESLKRKVWAPLAPLLTDVDHVFVVPEADLNLVPFAALPTGRTGYLIDAPYAMHYLSAERDLVAFTTKARAAGRGLLALGGPAYGATKQEAPIRLTVRGVSVTPTGPPQCVTLQSISFGELPAAAREAQEIAGLWRQLRPGGASDDARVDTLIGSAATEAAFKRAGAGRRILHLATHGFFLEPQCAPARAATGPARPPGAALGRTRVSSSLARSPLVFSGLALAGANRRHRPVGGVDDGILTAEEVAALDLDGVEWAVLSACDTGLGSIKTGEGVFGLRRAFEVAGARTVIMSLWSVEDRASRAWMRALYDGRLRAGLSTANALRHASRTILRERRARGLDTHPFFWAGFVAAGDWR
jgi:CHAT domain-containing protein